MSTQNNIGIESSKSKETAAELNKLLATFQVFYQNLRGYHWNIKGENFFELHLKFESFYVETRDQIDEIAERILTLGEAPLHTYKDYLANSAIKESGTKTDGKKIVSKIRDTYTQLLTQERAVLNLANKAGDEGTIDLMTGYIALQEKTVWMLSAYLG